VERIIDCVAIDKQVKFPVTVELLAARLGYNRVVVEKVFEELQISETGGA
jgi:DNA-binding IscR family transcriptional regulator